jgi:uracil-DNA glycosylase
MSTKLPIPELTPLDRWGGVHPSWMPVIEPMSVELDALADFLSSERRSGHEVIPEEHNILRAFGTPFDDVRVVIVGQDPYPTPGHAIGLSFSVSPETRPFPRSLANIFRELHSDMGIVAPASGDLTPWANQGVMLLNRVLTVRGGAAGSHRGKGWEVVTQQALQALDSRPGKPLVALLWGNDAQRAREFLPNSVILESAHPSPLSASRGYFGSRPFSKVNKALQAAGHHPINWGAAAEATFFY